RAEPGDDLISAMIHTPGPPPSDADLLSAVRLVLVSGHRAVTALVANGLLVLLQDREHWQRLVREPALVDSAVEELLRYVTPIALSVPRYANCPIEVGGVVIPDGEIIQAAWGAANRDPVRIEDPDRLDLARAPNGHLSFGHGHHYCPGAPLGRLEASIVLRTLVDRFPRIRLAADQPARFRTGSVRELVRLPVLLEPGAGGG
ncbi:MAG TPA: cytochrome P450, partial [Micromonosporaceae bacterium]